MRKVLLDTDVFSEILRAKNPVITRVARAYRAAHGCYTISAITVTEVVRGWERRGEAERVQRFVDSLSEFEVVGLDTEASVLAGKIAGELERVGTPIGLADPLIGGVAIARALPLVTNNVEHFERIVQLGYSLRIERCNELHSGWPWPATATRTD